MEEELFRDLFISRMRNVELQDTLTFETFTPEEVQKRAIKFEQSKQTTQAFQRSSTSTTTTGLLSNAQTKIKQEPIMAIGTKGYNKCLLKLFFLITPRQKNDTYSKKVIF